MEQQGKKKKRRTQNVERVERGENRVKNKERARGPCPPRQSLPRGGVCVQRHANAVADALTTVRGARSNRRLLRRRSAKERYVGAWLHSFSVSTSE